MNLTDHDNMAPGAMPEPTRAQQREAGRQNEAVRIRHLTYERDQFRTAQCVALNTTVDLRQRAEKAEASVRKISLELLAAHGEADAALARVKELETAFKNAGFISPAEFGAVSDPE